MSKGYSLVPSNYEFLKKLRVSKTASLKPCPYLKESVKLRYYQVIGTTHLLCLNRMILADSAGLGKTLEMIAAYCFMLQKDPTLKLLVVTPKSAMDQWQEEFYKFTTGIRVHVMANKFGKVKGQNKFAHIEYLKRHKIPFERFEGFDARKIQYDNVKANVLITSYFTVQEDHKFLIQNRSPNYAVVWDEAQEFKNRKAMKHLGADRISQQAVRVYGLSATIIKNRLEEAYNIYKVIVPGLFGSVAKFNKNFLKLKKFSKPNGKKRIFFNKIIGYKNLQKFREVIDPYFLIRKTKDVADELPSLISKKVVLEMTPGQLRLYQGALNGEIYRERTKIRYFEYRDAFEKISVHNEKEYETLGKLEIAYQESLTEEGLSKNKISALSYCQLISNGPRWLDIDETGEGSKEIEFRRLFDQELRAEKTIVFTRFKSGIPYLEAILNDLEIKHCKITGDVNKEDRTIARLAFQGNEKDLEKDLKKEVIDVPVIFITSAGSAALNLQSANVILFYDTPWSYGDLYQTIGRAQRIGSIHPHVHIIHMVNKKSIDEHVLKILEGKKELITNIMGDIAQGAIDFKGPNSVVFKDEESTIEAIFNSIFKKVH